MRLSCKTAGCQIAHPGTARRLARAAAVLAGLTAAAWLPAAARAEEPARAELAIHNHLFTPATLHLPADRKIILTVRNLDATAEEFESSDLNREKIVPPGAQIEVFLGPLDAGSYGFFGDFHPDTAQGKIEVP